MVTKILLFQGNDGPKGKDGKPGEIGPGVRFITSASIFCNHLMTMLPLFQNLTFHKSSAIVDYAKQK